jgi:electron transport complex protein RnfD
LRNFAKYTPQKKLIVFSYKSFRPNGEVPAVKKESKDKETNSSRPMTKDRLMIYTFVALAILAALAVVAFGIIDLASGITVLIMEIIGVTVAVISDLMLSRIMKKRGRLNLYSAAVSGLIAALAFSSGIPYPYTGPYIATMDPTMQYVAVAAISAITVVLFKKIQGLLGRKYVNPVAAAKLLVLAPLWSTDLRPMDHLVFKISSFPSLQEGLKLCYSSNAPFEEPLLTLTILKNHGWLGGASSIAVIVVGISLFLICRNYIKWRIPITFLATTAILSAGYGFIYGEDVVTRVAYHLFVGSIIFLAFFMVTDPPTTPLTGLGQIIFSVGVGVLAFVFQIWIYFLGGSLLALVIMNLTVPLLDRVGIHKPRDWIHVSMLPIERVEMYIPARRKTDCIRCSKCISACPLDLHPIMIFEAIEKGKIEKAKRLHLARCIGCGLCSYECPSGIPLAGTFEEAKHAIM